MKMKKYLVLYHRGYHRTMGVAISIDCIEWYIPADGVIGKIK